MSVYMDNKSQQRCENQRRVLATGGLFTCADQSSGATPESLSPTDLVKSSDSEDFILWHKLRQPTIYGYSQLNLLILLRSPGVGGRGGGVGGRPRRLSRASIFSCGNLSRLRGSRWRSLLWTRSSRSDRREPRRHRPTVCFLNHNVMNPVD